MALGGYAIGGTKLGAESIAALPSMLEVFINGVDRNGPIQVGTLEIQRALNERSRAKLTLLNPTFAPDEGDTVMIRRDGLWRFGGVIEKVRRTANADNLKTFKADCVDWTRILERRLITSTYTDKSTQEIIRDAIDTILADDGLWESLIEAGPTFPLVDAKNIRCSELFRDVAEGSGHSWWIDPEKGLHFIKTLVHPAPFELIDGVVTNPELDITREQYRNAMRIKVRGTPGESEQPVEVIVDRDDTTEIAARQAIEGGSGRYEVFEDVTHPDSNDPVACQRLGITYAIMRLNRSGQARKQLSGTVWRFGLEPGQLASVTLPAYDITGSWLITRVREVCLNGLDWRYDFEALLTSPLELAIDSYLRIVQAGRATILLPVGLFQNVANFVAPGTTTWTVPGSGTVELEITPRGAGGGGGGYSGILGQNGGAGGPGGRATTFLSVPAGTVLDITVGAGGTGGVGDQTPTTVTFNTPGTTTWTVPGSGTVQVEMTTDGAGGGGGGDMWSIGSTHVSGYPGGAGGRATTTRTFPAGTVLTVVVGQGGTGGSPGRINGAPAPGNGTAGTLSKVTDGVATTYAQGDPGTGGQYNNGGSNVPGSPGGGSGDSVISGGGAAGGAGGTGSGSMMGNAGQPGGNGVVTFRWIDADSGVAGGLSKVEQGGVTVAQGDGGAGGAAGQDGGTTGASGSGTGDQVYVGGGFLGGDGGVLNIPDGENGENGSVEIRY